MSRWMIGLLAWAAWGCSDKVDAKGAAGATYTRLFAPIATPSLLKHADGLTGAKPTLVVALRSVEALLGAPLVQALRTHPITETALAQVREVLRVDPLAAVALDQPIVVVVHPTGVIARFTATGDGLMALQSTLALLEGAGTPLETLGFKGAMTRDGKSEACVLTQGKLVIVGAGEGAVCSGLPALASAGPGWRKGVEAAEPAAPPLLSVYHGDTRGAARVEGVPLLVQALGGLHQTQGLLELTAPGDELAVRYRGRPVDDAALTAQLAAAQRRLPPLAIAPKTDPLVFQVLVPGSLRDVLDPGMINGLLGAQLFPTAWPADQLVAAVLSFGPFGGTMALGDEDAAAQTATVGRIAGKAADFDDAKAWTTEKGVCGAGPGHTTICANSRARVSASIARARGAAVPAGQLYYMHFDLTSLQDDPVAYGFPPEAVGFVKAVRQGTARARLVDGWMTLDVELQGTTTPARAALLGWVRAQL